MERNETITWISGEQNDLRTFKPPARDEIFAANPVPTIALCTVLEDVMRKYNARKAGQVKTSSTQCEIQAEPSAEISTKKCPNPRATTLREGQYDSVTTGKFARPTAKIPSS